ncbi:hypothetical protein ADUPG1_009709, partial [Aduncisulcus paluster]
FQPGGPSTRVLLKSPINSTSYVIQQPPTTLGTIAMCSNALNNINESLVLLGAEVAVQREEMWKFTQKVNKSLEVKKSLADGSDNSESAALEFPDKGEEEKEGKEEEREKEKEGKEEEREERKKKGIEEGATSKNNNKDTSQIFPFLSGSEFKKNLIDLAHSTIHTGHGLNLEQIIRNSNDMIRSITSKVRLWKKRASSDGSAFKNSSVALSHSKSKNRHQQGTSSPITTLIKEELDFDIHQHLDRMLKLEHKVKDISGIMRKKKEDARRVLESLIESSKLGSNSSDYSMMVDLFPKTPLKYSYQALATTPGTSTFSRTSQQLFLDSTPTSTATKSKNRISRFQKHQGGQGTPKTPKTPLSASPNHDNGMFFSPAIETPINRIARLNAKRDATKLVIQTPHTDVIGSMSVPGSVSSSHSSKIGTGASSSSFSAKNRSSFVKTPSYLKTPTYFQGQSSSMVMTPTSLQSFSTSQQVKGSVQGRERKKFVKVVRWSQVDKKHESNNATIAASSSSSSSSTLRINQHPPLM